MKILNRRYLRLEVAEPWNDFTFWVWRFMLTCHHWRKPLEVKHHESKYADVKKRPRPGRRVDWAHYLGNNKGPWHILWIYTRDRDGRVLGRTIEWCWRPKQRRPKVAA